MFSSAFIVHAQQLTLTYHHIISTQLFNMSGKPSDDQLRQAIDAIFSKYDTDKSGTLEGNEIYNLINDAFKSLGRNRQVQPQEVDQFIKAIDKNNDAKISKPELFEILKRLIAGN